MFSKIRIKIFQLLRSAERYTLTDMVYVVRQGFWSFSNQVVSSTSSAIAVIVLANILSKESFGQYRYVLSVIPIVALFTLPGVAPAITRSVARDESVDLPKTVRTEVRWGLFGSLAALGIAIFYFVHGDGVLSSAFVITALSLPLLQSFSIYSAYLKGKRDFKTATIYGSISSVFQVAVLIIAAFATKNILVVLGSFLFGQIVAQYFFYKKTLHGGGPVSPGDIAANQQSESVIRYGKLLTTTQLVSTITGNIDKLVVGYFLGVETLAIYSIALTIPSNLVLLFNVVPRIAFPKFSKNEWGPDERTKIVRKLLLFLAALVVPAVLYFLLVPIAIPLLFREYGASIPAALVLTFLVLISPLNAVIDQVFQARKQVRSIVFLQILTLCVFSGVFLILWRVFGANPIDAAIALVVSEALQFLVGIILLRR